MSVVVETTLGDITVDLFIKERPRASLNFLKLCKLKYYNFNLFHTVSRRFIAQTGDPTGSRSGGESIFGVLDGPLKRFFEAETNPRIKHTTKGLISFVGNEENMIGSQFFFTLADDLTYLDEKHCVFGEVAEGLDVLDVINEAICDSDDRPYQDIRITHTVILDDPFPDLEKMHVPSRSPSPSAERLQGGRIAPDEEIDEIAGKNAEEINELIAEREAKARATILEMVGDLPDADMAPPENVLFVCKLNPVTSDDDLEIIFSRFGKIKSCEVIRDHKTGDSLQYAFIEFEDKKSCEEAYFKMDNVLIDDRRIHVDFSQSVSKVKWMGKGRGVKHFNENGSERKKYDSERTNSDKYKKSQKNTRRNEHSSMSESDKKRKYYGSSRYLSSPNSRGRSPSYDHKRAKRHESSSKYRSYEEKNHECRSSSSDYRRFNKKDLSRSRHKGESYHTFKGKKKSRSSKSPSPVSKKSSRSRSKKSRSSSNEIKKARLSSPEVKNRRSHSRSSSPYYRNSTNKSSVSKNKKKRYESSEDLKVKHKSRRSRSSSQELRKSKNKRNGSKNRKKRSRSTSSSSSSSVSPKHKIISRPTEQYASPSYKKSKSKKNRSRSRSKSHSEERMAEKKRSHKRKSRSLTPEHPRRK